MKQARQASSPTESPGAEFASVERRAVLVGRQNSGKTSLLMHLTGTAQRPVNFPGTSVERAESTVGVGDVVLRIVDIPGIGSLEPISPDERVAVDFLRGLVLPNPDGHTTLVPVIDASKLTIELHLLRALASLRLPVVVALTKSDVAARQGKAVDVKALSAALGVPVLAVDGAKGAGADELRLALVRESGSLMASGFDPDELAGRVEVQHDSASRTLSERLDQLLLHRVWGLPVAALAVYAIFQAIFTGADPFIGGIEAAQEAVGGWIAAQIAPGALRAFLVDGLVNGVGSVLVFLPQIILLIALVTALEASGYMARVAFLLDRVLNRVGLSGRSFVPLVSSFACAIPGIMATRIIDNERDRLATIAVAPLMSCSARMPVYVVLIGAFFPTAYAGLVLFAMYALGIITAALVAAVLRKTVLRGGASPLLMELPSYQRPSLRVVWAQVRTASVAFLTLAGSVIFAATILIWLLSYYPRPSELHERYEAQRVEAQAELVGSPQVERIMELDSAEKTAFLEQSYLARFGKSVQPLFAPAGFDWRTTVGVLAAFPAREVIIPTLGVLYSAGEVDPGDYDLASLESVDQPNSLRDRLRESRDKETGRHNFDMAVALSLMVFFALCSQCVSTLGTIRRETRSWRWPVFVFTYMTALAWLAAVAVYQVSSSLL